MKKPDKIVIDYGLALDYLNIGLAMAFLIFIIALITKDIVFGSSSGNWVYPYINAFTVKPILIFLLITPFILFLVYLTHNEIYKHEIKIICLWFIVGFICQICIRSLYPYSFGTIIQSDIATSYYSPTIRYSALELISNYDSIADTLPLHARINIPGKIFFFYFLRIFTSSPHTMGYLIILFSNIGAVLTYVISKKLFKNYLIAIYSLILYLFIPAKLFFFPILNTVSPVFILLSLVLFVQYLESHKDIYLILLGLSIYLIVFFEPTLLASGIIFLAFLAKYYWEKKINKVHLLKIGLYGLVSFLSMHVLFLLVFKYNIINNMLFIFNLNVDFYSNNPRSYKIWLFHNLRLFFINLGLIQSFLFWGCSFIILAKFINIYKNKVHRKKNILKFIFEPGPLLTLSFIVLLLFMDLTGIIRGEASRHWIFLMVFVQIIVSYFCVTKLNNRIFYLVLTTTLLQTVITISMVGFVIPSDLL